MLIFKGKDIIYKIAAKFTHAFLPEAQKPFYLKPAHQQELDIKGIAAKADICKIKTNPDVIIEGFSAVVELIYYLTADGYKVITDIFSAYVRFPGEYSGNETSLPNGIYPVVRLQPSAEFHKYIKVEFDGIENTDGFIAEA